MANAIENVNPLRRYSVFAGSQTVSWTQVSDSNGSQTDPSNSPDAGKVSGNLFEFPGALADIFGSAGSGVRGISNNLSNVAGISGGGQGLTVVEQRSLPDPWGSLGMPSSILLGNNTTADSAGALHNRRVAYIPDGTTLEANTTRILTQISPGSLLVPIEEEHILAVRYGTFATGSGNQWRPSVRRVASGTIVAESPNVDVVTGTDGLDWHELVVPAGDRTIAHYAEPTRLSNGPWIGPGLILHSQWFLPVSTGLVTSPGLLQGGLGSLEATATLKAASVPALAEWLRGMVYAQTRLGQEETLCVQWLHGGNDRNDQGQPSWTPGGDPVTRSGPSSALPEGFYNNVRSGFDRIRDGWQFAGFDLDRLFLCVGPYTEQASHVDALSGYEDAALQLVSDFPQQAFVVRGTEIYDSRVFDDANWYRDGSGEGTDDAHLRFDGYLAAAGMFAAAIRGAISGAATAAGTAIVNAPGLSSLTYARDAATIRPPLRILDAAGEPVLGLTHDAPGLAIEWRRVGGPVAWTAAPQTAETWQETGNGFYEPTITVGNQAGETVAIRWTYGGVTSLPGLVSFPGAEETSGSVSLTQAQIDAIASAASSSAGETMRSITVPISGTVDAGSFTVTVTSADPLEDTAGWIIESQVGSRPFSTVILSASAEGDGTHTLTLDRPFPDFFPAGGSLKITDTPFRHFTGAGRSWPASPRVPAGG